MARRRDYQKQRDSFAQALDAARSSHRQMRHPFEFGRRRLEIGQRPVVDDEAADMLGEMARKAHQHGGIIEHPGCRQVLGRLDRTPPLWPRIPATTAESGLSDAMIAYWTSFAKDGQPRAANAPSPVGLRAYCFERRGVEPASMRMARAFFSSGISRCRSIVSRPKPEPKRTLGYRDLNTFAIGFDEPGRPGDRALTLRHTPYQRRPLNEQTDEVLKHVARLWGFDVRLETVDEHGTVSGVRERKWEKRNRI